MKNNHLSILAIVLSTIAILLTFFRITPIEFSNDIYLGLLATFIGISVTMLIGYQIVNTMEIKKEITAQQKMSSELKQINVELNKAIENQRNEMREGHDILTTLIEYQENGFTYSAAAFCSLHHALSSSIKTQRTEYEWIFNLLRKYISDINWQNFLEGFQLTTDGRCICNTPCSPFYKKELKDAIKTYTDQVDEDEVVIRNNENFCRVQMEYDRVLKLFRERIEEILKDPNKYLTPEEKFAITNPH